MIVDEHGGQEFQESLKSYVAERFVDDLFGDKDAFQTMASKDNVLVQVADFFAGSSRSDLRRESIGRSFCSRLQKDPTQPDSWNA
jgi:hypothetical protein